MKQRVTEITLHREYHELGTNGTFIFENWEICEAIELPWNNNERNISCIPEGRYIMEMYPSSKFGMRLLVKDVPNRNGILLHPANNALKELRGCIAPVTHAYDWGLGSHSRAATENIERIFRAIPLRPAKMILNITSDFGEPGRKPDKLTKGF